MKNFLNTAKSKILALSSLLIGTSAFAEDSIKVDPATGIISGTLNTAPFLTGAAVIIGGLAVFWCLKRVIALFSK